MSARKIVVIGIGAGNPEHMTVQAINALNRLDAVLIPRKGESKADLAELRRDICRRYLTNPRTRQVEFDLPARDATEASYAKAVGDWHAAIAEIYRDLFAAEPDDAAIGLLVWGDPSLYDSTLRILDRVKAIAGFPIGIEVIPGITSMQALAASHRIPINPVGGPFAVTTGRRLRGGFPPGTDSAVVMLDGECSFTHLPPDEYDIYWGAYLGMPQEKTIAGPLSEVGERILRERDQARARNGWIMDVYLLRRKGQ